MTKRIQGCVALCKKSKMRMTFRKPAPLLLISFLLAVSIAWPQVSTNGPADHVYRNGVIFTADARHRTAEALAIRDGRIVYVGDNRGLTPFVGGVDRDGRLERTLSDAGPGRRPRSPTRRQGCSF